VTAFLVLGALAAAVAATPLPSRAVIAIRRRRDGRARAARRGLPGLVDALASALRSGLSLPQAFAEVAPSLPADLAAPSRVTAASLFLGASIADALRAYEGVLPAQDLAPLGVVLTSFHRSGGRVGESLGRIATLLRGRLALDDERAALTAQGRASALVLIALAPLGAVFFAVALPDYGETLIRDGLVVAALALAFEVAGALWLWWIVKTAAPRDDLATLLDAVIVGLDSGLTFERALASIVERAPDLSRAADACRLLADLRLGVGTTAALREFARLGPDEARIAALVTTSSRFGSPLAQLLVVQADALRDAERHRAETTARRLPVLMLFPLALCILPALLLVFLGPPLLSLLR
jgi:Flp pilus assembly protein TadB